MASTTKGSQNSEFPDDLPDLTAQSETRDQGTTEYADGADYNIVAAEIEAIADALGVGGRGEVSVPTTTATIESLSYVWGGVKKTYAGETGRSLQAGQNYIYLDMESNTVQISSSGWPGTIPHIKLATYNKTTTTLVDMRPHDLGVSNMRPVLCSETSEYVESGELLITSGNTTGVITFPITFDGAPDLTLGVRLAADATIRNANYYSLTDTGASIIISPAAPASGVRVSWMAKGPYTPRLTGSG
jgi:hypothetical protein